MDKTLPINLIKFNCANEFAVNLFARKKINYGKINKIIEKSLSLDFNSNRTNAGNYYNTTVLISSNFYNIVILQL